MAAFTQSPAYHRLHFWSLVISHITHMQGSVATRVGCGGTFNDDFIAHFPESVPVKEFLKIR